MKPFTLLALLSAVVLAVSGAPVETEVEVVETETKQVTVEDEQSQNEVGIFARVRTRFYKMCGCGGGGGSGCFAGETQVVTPLGLRPISEIDAGDQVMVVDEEGHLHLDTVYLQAHKAAQVEADYIRLLTLSGRTLSLSREHYIYIDGQMMEGQKVRVGDQVSVLDPRTHQMVSDLVVSVSVVRASGVYNPWTLSGHLLAGGLHSSAYSADTRPFSPAALHTLFWPLRQLSKVTDLTFQGTPATEGQPEWLALLECMLHKINK